MKRQILISLFLLAIFCVGSSVPAQKTEKEKLNFSGTWIYDKSKSPYGIVPPGSSKTFVQKLIITQSDPEIKIIEQTELNGKVLKSVESIHFTDERGETNFGENQQEIESVTKAKDKTVTVTFYRKNDKGDKKRTSLINLTISKDGKTLTLTSADAKYAGSQATAEGIGALFQRNNISRIFKKEQ